MLYGRGCLVYLCGWMKICVFDDLKVQYPLTTDVVKSSHLA